jgi:hypothetical protein
MPRGTNFLLIRHAEKPDDQNDTGLSVPGQARAMAYVVYFQNYKINSNPVKLGHLFATAQSPRSNRPYLTIEPLARQLGLQINNFYENRAEDIEALAKYLLIDPTFNNATVLICWHHQELLHLAQALGAQKHTLPTDWPEDTFGWLIEICFDGAGNLALSGVIEEKLMYTDCKR